MAGVRSKDRHISSDEQEVSWPRLKYETHKEWMTSDPWLRGKRDEIQMILTDYLELSRQNTSLCVHSKSENDATAIEAIPLYTCIRMDAIVSIYLSTSKACTKTSLRH